LQCQTSCSCLKSLGNGRIFRLAFSKFAAANAAASSPDVVFFASVDEDEDLVLGCCDNARIGAVEVEG